ncbi:hypothetical protein ABFS83_01G087200 [Erythranthe nasuta]
MLIGSECGLNLLIGFDDSLQKVVTQTILTQEEIFKNQVLELHRLYEIQTVLMNELDLNVRDGESSNLCFGPSSKNSKYEPFAREMKSSEVHTICSSRPMRMSLDLELPASHYISDNEVSAITKHDLEPSFCGVNMSYKNMSARRKLFRSHKRELFDLNKALPDESSSGVSNNEDTFFTVLDWRKPYNSTLMTSASKDSDEIICQSTFRGPQLDAKGHVPLSEMNVEGADSNRSPVSCKSDSITETKSQPSDRTKEKIDGVDRTVRAGAVSLVYFSLECSSKKNQDHSIEPKKRKECCNSNNNNNEKDGYESSSESYESIVLREPECGAGDYGMTSALMTEATILSDKKEHGMKLRRGRRMKDFRKEILPNMASLSREEIREDIKIMQLAVRSREYKKYKSKSVKGSRCVSSVVKSKRSRVSSVGPKYNS